MNASEYIAEISSRCTGCGVCISKCPEKALEFFTEDYVKRARCIETICTGCGICASHCSFYAIKIVKKKPTN
ncbi:4Fe-4S ferredoxin iron-sulfur binding domain protein [Denitrovibrio acetiphilus DSM 12809]|uniref:4Fe-4S ferredoxin iron-sulfur binding domain protein n=1 Tax=Denitrovibrio acetiphilus (strain DSM 12809 / NBRC 114555 / N2460) TaxID=522772 RepID=D4H2B1_DENA2|nr:4Fe-4S dicluster domain-containing protein [Denitrovibrio acetiphilus]ADD68902.1 4Fe-4S ferredoxin iron-sulfur binding domain protein [Denitrovibrio acetiphilus DSM 12809]